MYTQMKCPYCGKDVHLVTGKEIYPHRNDLHMKNFWLCEPCNAYTGTHEKNPKRGFNGTEPLGTLANAKLRKLRKDIHAVFDLIWQEKHFSRTDAYSWLAKQMNIQFGDEYNVQFNVYKHLDGKFYQKPIQLDSVFCE